MYNFIIKSFDVYRLRKFMKEVIFIFSDHDTNLRYMYLKMSNVFRTVFTV